MSGRAVLLAVAVIGLGACGSSDRGQAGNNQAPASAGERAAVAEIKYCLEGAGAVTGAPGKTIPELGNAPGGQDVQGAKRVLVAAWADTKHSASVYYGDSDGAAANAAGGLGKGAQQKGRVIVAPGDTPLSDDEALLVSDCLP